MKFTFAFSFKFGTVGHNDTDEKDFEMKKTKKEDWNEKSNECHW